MDRNACYILSSGLMIAVCSLIYFFALVLSLPLWLIVALLLLSAYGIVRYGRAAVLSYMGPHQAIAAPYPLISMLLLIAATALMVWNTYPLSHKYGAWDAWWFWNYRARYMADPQLWQMKQLAVYPRDLAANRVAHADYPPALPAFIGCCWRLLGNHSRLVPYITAFFFSLAIPVLLYLELYRRNLVLGAVVLLLFITDKYYLYQGVSMMADIWVAFFLLAAFVTMHHYKCSRHPLLITLAALSLGALAWTKNEGIMLAILFMLFYARTIATGRWYFLRGIALPLAGLLLFKACYAPPGDIFSGMDALSRLREPGRYEVVWTNFLETLRLNFPLLKFWLLALVLVCLLKRRMPGREFLLILIFAAGYCLVYIMTPHNIDWHVSTSIDRVVLQLMPSFIYLTARGIAGRQLPQSQISR